MCFIYARVQLFVGWGQGCVILNFFVKKIAEIQLRDEWSLSTTLGEEMAHARRSLKIFRIKICKIIIERFFFL